MGSAVATTGGVTKGGKGGGKVLPNSASVTIVITAGIARGLLQSLTLGRPLTGPGVNILIRKLSQAVIVSSSKKKGGPGTGPGKTPKSGPGGKVPKSGLGGKTTKPPAGGKTPKSTH
jgi:hypothetical protein